jgi:deoxycytidine triphosphate deaminase
MKLEFENYKELWQLIFPKHYKDKYKHESGLSGGGGDYPVYDIHIAKNPYQKNEKGFHLAYSKEYFEVPHNVMLITKNKSTIARQGIDASFSTFIDNGFKGHLTIEIINHKGAKIIDGQPILQVVALPLMFPCDPYNGKYQNQEAEPVEARFIRE